MTLRVSFSDIVPIQIGPRIGKPRMSGVSNHGNKAKVISFSEMKLVWAIFKLNFVV